MNFSVKEIYHTIQGEGARSGRAAVFCRFSGCNLWSGLEHQRKNAVCNFCDTDFNGTDGQNGGKFLTAEKLASTIERVWVDSTSDSDHRYIVFTGGEPGLQISAELVSSLQTKRFEVAIETNGTVALPENLDWVTVSPKTWNSFVVTKGSELKFVFPQKKLAPEEFKLLDFEHFYIQPKFDEQYDDNLLKSLDFCLKYPKWKLSLQTHKYVGIL
ncbi:MAG: 7-carboxy-7-deazaguanine synthase [Methylococcaceae bacterium TMED69]|nr:MAG: 7-carboxy-7-deazaguanine synthase [Methylococcaceae bacterium TMED69]